MAWRCSGNTNVELVTNLTRAGLLSTPRVVEAFTAVDRGHFCSQSPYVDSPAYIGHGATISAPHMHAHAIENLEPFLQPGAAVLDVGSGSGYLLAIMHQLVSERAPKPGRAVGIDHIDALVQLSLRNLKRSTTTAAALESGLITVLCGDGRAGAPANQLPSEGFDAIHVGAAAPEMPTRLIEQLKKPGRMFIPVGTRRQAIFQVDKDRDGRVTQKELFGVNYVPLTDREKQDTGSP